MTDRPVIAVSQRVDSIPARGETRDALDQRLIRWVLALGASPLPVPNTLGEALSGWLQRFSPVAIVLSGGNDIGTSQERDRTEAFLIDHAAATGLPLLGICRGMQMLAHHAGGALVRLSGHAGCRHPLRGEVAGVRGEAIEVNSFHDWGLRDSPPGYRPLATAADGTLEAMRHERHRWEAWMWHPEREADFNAADIAHARELLLGSRQS